MSKLLIPITRREFVRLASQLGPLELEPEGMLEHEVSLGGESIAWVR